MTVFYFKFEELQVWNKTKHSKPNTLGMASKTNDIRAASPYCLYAAAFCLILSASALPIASIAAASAAPTICKAISEIQNTDVKEFGKSTTVPVCDNQQRVGATC